MTAPGVVSLLPTQPRARGEARLTVGRRDKVTVLRDFYQSGSLKCLFPRTPDAELTAVTLNTAGGLTGGDTIRLDIVAQDQSHVVLTTQAAERVYCAQPGEIAKVTTTLRAEDGATLAWLPQETLLYDGGSLARRLRVDLTGSAQVLLVEPLVFGRTAMEERLHNVHFTDRIDIVRDGTLQVADRTRLTGNANNTLAKRAVAQGANAMATVMFAVQNAGAKLDQVRNMLPDLGGASVQNEHCMIVRVLAEDSHELRKTLIPLLQFLHKRPLPRTWTL